MRWRWPLCGTSAATLPTTGALMRQPERLVDVDRRRRQHVLDVDAFVHGDRAIGGHAVGDEHLPDRLGRGDEAVDLPVLPSRERVAAQVEVDAARRRRAPARAAGALTTRSPSTAPARPSRRRARRGRGRRPGQPPDDARQPPRGREIDFAARRDRDELEPFGRAPPQLAVGCATSVGAVSDRAQAVHGQQHLVLPATPGPGGVDVEGEHQVRFTKDTQGHGIIAVQGFVSDFVLSATS